MIMPSIYIMYRYKYYMSYTYKYYTCLSIVQIIHLLCQQWNMWWVVEENVGLNEGCYKCHMTWESVKCKNNGKAKYFNKKRLNK